MEEAESVHFRRRHTHAHGNQTIDTWPTITNTRALRQLINYIVTIFSASKVPPEYVNFFQDAVYKEIQNYPEFGDHNLLSPPIDEQQRHANKSMFILPRLKTFPGYSPETFKGHVMCLSALGTFNTTGVFKYVLSYRMVLDTIKALGTDRHRQYIDQLANREVCSIL